jgi:hypothetical protein
MGGLPRRVPAIEKQPVFSGTQLSVLIACQTGLPGDNSFCGGVPMAAVFRQHFGVKTEDDVIFPCHKNLPDRIRFALQVIAGERRRLRGFINCHDANVSRTGLSLPWGVSPPPSNRAGGPPWSPMPCIPFRIQNSEFEMARRKEPGNGGLSQRDGMTIARHFNAG